MLAMSEHVAGCVMGLSTDERFTALLEYFSACEREMQKAINSTMTPADEREILVHLRQQLKGHVIDVVKNAQRVLRAKQDNTGQA